MPSRLGQFEIQSELAKSPTSVVYKANQAGSGETIALKAIQLNAFGEHMADLEQALLQEAERAKVLASPNLTVAGNPAVIEGQFCASMEYVQGNSIATMLARKEGFSIWDLLDIGRQLCGGLEHASSHQVLHRSLEPSKIMCGWDGTVKILSFGLSSVGDFVQYASGVSSLLFYMSPEQFRGETIDIRSNLFSLGAIFYEMVTEKKAFSGTDVESLRHAVLESTPIPPIQLNAKVHPLLSDLIVKALSKDPAQRYQNGRALLDDLENCKEARPAARKPAPAPSAGISGAAKAVAQSKFVGSTAPQMTAPPAAPPRPAIPAAPAMTSSPAAAAAKPVMKPVEKTFVPPKPAAPIVQPTSPGKPSRLATPKTVATPAIGRGPLQPASPIQSNTPDVSSDASDEILLETFDSTTTASGSKIAVDPLMSESAPAASGTSFSEIAELPPLKEVYVAPEPPAEIPAVQPAISPLRGASKPPVKPAVQPRVVAKQAIKEIRSVPPQLMMYSLAGAGILILAIAIGITIYIHGQGDDDSGSRRPVPAAAQPAADLPDPIQHAPLQETAPAQAESQPVEIPDSSAPSDEPTEATTARPRHRTAKAAPVPGQLTIDSTPQGAEVQFDGSSDPSWVTPFTLTNVQPGQHSITVTKAGFSPGTRNVEMVSGGRSSATVHLSQLTATLLVKSDPPGANIFLDNHDTGTRTPAQISVAKGQHYVIVRMNGYLEESTTAQAVLGQTVSFSPTLRPLGNVDDMKTVGKVSKLFHKGGNSSQGVLSIHTQPKGAQIAINQHMLEKNSPVDVSLDPGNYVIDISMSGYAPIHKVVTTESGGKVTLDEVLQPQ